MKHYRMPSSFGLSPRVAVALAEAQASAEKACTCGSFYWLLVIGYWLLVISYWSLYQRLH
jgi:hypothetical protein